MNRARTGRRTPRPRLPLRGRLTLVTTVVFALLGCGLLVLNWLSSRQLIEDNRYLIVPAVDTNPARPPEPPATVPAQTSGPGSATSPAPLELPDPNATFEAPAATVAPAQGFEEFQRSVLGDLLARSLLLLLVFTALAALLAWWAGRRSLLRLSQVTAAARRIGSGSTLDERLALTGPHDEVRELGDTFDAMLDRLDRSFTAQRRFTAHASHELRTPLTLQRTALEIPLAQGRVPADLRPDLQRALDANARTERLIAALLTLARGESERPAPYPADLADVAGAAVGDLAEEARAAGVLITSDTRPAPVTGDVSLLRQIALNLVANAVRHNHPGGTATVTTGTAGDRSFVEVGNTGPVLDPAEVPELFEPFRRGTERRADGTGLGLAVVRAITATHHGRVTAEPRPHGGLTVRVELPRRTPGRTDHDDAP
ncbi:HAMP domain-containing sensor histidine kinase [Streptomyces sp. NPDC093111]|uniref:sensor histidine kinase n=1 Tax=Streptomyces sp. NPDC093111 TaxID=3154978 RepID=UPI003418E0A5